MASGCGEIKNPLPRVADLGFCQRKAIFFHHMSGKKAFFHCLLSEWQKLIFPSRNCNHFSDDLVTELLGSGIPNWVNRTSWWLVMMECCIPAKYFPKTPGSELSDEVTGQCSNCSCGHGDWGQGKSLADDSGTYSPLPQDPVERRMAVKNAVMTRNSIHQ